MTHQIKFESEKRSLLHAMEKELIRLNKNDSDLYNHLIGDIMYPQSEKQELLEQLRTIIERLEEINQ